MAKILNPEFSHHRLVIQANYTNRYGIIMIKGGKDASLCVYDRKVGGLANISGASKLRKLARAILAEVEE